MFVFPTSAIVLAPAKINMHLQITGLFDDGRHALNTSFAFVDVYDTLHIQTAKKLQVECSVGKLSGENNLVFQVLNALQQQYKCDKGLNIYIEKHLPAQAGLGGGSSDAASALLAANHLWQLGLSQQQLISLATPFGADIPCFLYGQASLAKGVGERLSPYPESLENKYICLARPSQGLSTKAVFQHYDKQLNSKSPLTHHIAADTIRAASQGKIPVGENALEKSAIALLPEIDLLLKVMREFSNMAWMSGSGSTCVALCSSYAEATQLAKHLQQCSMASWTHAGKLLNRHPAFTDNIGA